MDIKICLNCKYCIENIEEFEDGGWAWHECGLTGQMIEHIEDCPIVRGEDEEEDG